jgi:catechol 2,3-dioxygenase-like lactoylglutathione lyase family enzyme
MSVLPITSQITFLSTRDLAMTAQFYEEVMGLPLVVDQGRCRIYHVVGEAYVGFCERGSAPKPPEKPQGVIFTLVTPDVDGWHERLRAQGVSFEKAPARNETYGIYHCFLRDPNGYLLEIQRFLDENWAKVT